MPYYNTERSTGKGEEDMYLRILKKDLKRKKTMNLILLIFIILAAMFIASSVGNMVTVFTALDAYFEKAHNPKEPERIQTVWGVGYRFV